MGEEIAFKNGQISNFQGLVTLTLDRVILHTLKSKKLCGRTDGHLRVETHFIRSK